jgi:hypothetical protein
VPVHRAHDLGNRHVSLLWKLHSARVNEQQLVSQQPALGPKSVRHPRSTHLFSSWKQVYKRSRDITRCWLNTAIAKAVGGKTRPSLIRYLANLVAVYHQTIIFFLSICAAGASEQWRRRVQVRGCRYEGWMSRLERMRDGLREPDAEAGEKHRQEHQVRSPRSRCLARCQKC